MPDVTIEKKVVLDLLPDSKPGTSATSDVPVVETRPDASPAATDKVTTEDVTATPESESSSAEPEAKKPAKGVQKRLDELTRNWRNEERARRIAEENLQKALALLEKGPQTKADTSTDDPEPVEPDPSKYNDQNVYNADYREYFKKLARWEGRQELKSQQKRDAEERSKKSREEDDRKRVESYQSNVAKARDKYPDYDDVTGNPYLPITAPMRDAIFEAGEQGPHLAYHLGQNPDEAERISKLSPRAQFLELGRIAAKLTQPATTQVSRAPKPIKPLESASGAATSSDEESMEAYAAKRIKQLQEERRPGRR